MKTLIVLECERHIQPFMRAMLNVAQNSYDRIIIITNPITKGETITNTKIEHIEIDKTTRLTSIALAPIRLFAPSTIEQISTAAKKGKLNKAYLNMLKLYLCYGIAFYRKALPYVKESISKGELHIMSCWFFVDSLTTARLKKRFPQIKACSLAHSFEIDPLKNDFVELLFNKWKHKYLDKIFFISEKMRDIYNHATHYRYAEEYKEQMNVAYLGCIKMFEGNNPYTKNDKIRIVSCSYVRPEKRINLILDIFENWTECSIEWIHFGNGPQLEDMRTRGTKIMETNKNVIIDFKGYVSNEDVQKYYTTEQVDLFINLSSSEGVPVSIMEAIAYGIPVVATDVGGVCEIIEEKHGLLVAPDAKANDIIPELEVFISNYRQNALSLRANANLFWQNRFNAISNYTNLFKEINNI